MPRDECSFRPARSLVGETVLEFCREAFRWLGSPDYLRVDDRWDNGVFSFLELSPTLYFQYLSALSAVARGMGQGPSDMLRKLVELCLVRERG